jgi:bacillithiol biosynthesis deacetylase BshB1
VNRPAPLDVLAFAAHPDDVELFAGGTIALLVSQGYRVGICDLTRGELGSRGTPELRRREALEAGRILGIESRENIGLADGDIANTAENRWLIARMLRKYRPHIALIGAPDCRHPDHPAAARLVADAIFPAGLAKIETRDLGEPQEPWRPQHVLHYMQNIPFEPTLVVDVSDVWETRMEALLAYRSQFFSGEYEAGPGEPETYISNPDYLASIEARARVYGQRIGARFGEPFLYRHGPIGTNNLMSFLERGKPHR